MFNSSQDLKTMFPIPTHSFSYYSFAWLSASSKSKGHAVLCPIDAILLAPITLTSTPALAVSRLAPLAESTTSTKELAIETVTERVIPAAVNKKAWIRRPGKGVDLRRIC
jgi:hypothetical protein